MQAMAIKTLDLNMKAEQKKFISYFKQYWLAILNNID